jgi:hypothetical protein
MIEIIKVRAKSIKIVGKDMTQLRCHSQTSCHIPQGPEIHWTDDYLPECHTTMRIKARFCIDTAL